MYKQREQWATDSLRLLFWGRPLRDPGLSLNQRLQYFYTGYGYLVSAFVLPFFYLIPAWSALSGSFILNTSALSYAAFRGVYLLCTFLTLLVLEHPVDSRKPYRMWAGLFPVFMRATVRALRSRREKPRYVVNPKTARQLTLLHRLRAVLPQAGIIGVTILALIYAAIYHTLPLGLWVVNAVWGLWIVWTLLGICHAALQRRLPPTHPGLEC